MLHLLILTLSTHQAALTRCSLQADRLTAALRKGTTEAFATDDGELQLGGRFVWKKKIEHELQGGARTKDIYERERKNTEAERKVSTHRKAYCCNDPRIICTSQNQSLPSPTSSSLLVQVFASQFAGHHVGVLHVFQ